MSVNIKQNGDLIKVANNISIVQANWNDKDNTSKSTCIKNQPATLKTLEEISANTDENALAGASAVKELIETGAAGGGNNIVYLTKAEYEALPDSKLTDDVEYRITDANTANKIAATDITYGDSNVQDAVDEVQESVSALNDSLSNLFSDSLETVTLPFTANTGGMLYVYMKEKAVGSGASYLYLNSEKLGNNICNLSSPESASLSKTQWFPIVKGDTISISRDECADKLFKFLPFN